MMVDIAVWAPLPQLGRPSRFQSSTILPAQVDFSLSYKCWSYKHSPNKSLQANLCLKAYSAGNPFKTAAFFKGFLTHFSSPRRKLPSPSLSCSLCLSPHSSVSYQGWSIPFPSIEVTIFSLNLLTRYEKESVNSSIICASLF